MVTSVSALLLIPLPGSVLVKAFTITESVHIGDYWRDADQISGGDARSVSHRDLAKIVVSVMSRHNPESFVIFRCYDIMIITSFGESAECLGIIRNRSSPSGITT